jgi:hypothetical protein
MIRHLLQIFFTLGLTFIPVSFCAGLMPGHFVPLVCLVAPLAAWPAAAARWVPYLYR